MSLSKHGMFKQIFGNYVCVPFLLKLLSKVNKILLSFLFIRVCDLCRHSCAPTMIIEKAFDVFLHYPLFMFSLINVLRNPRLILKINIPSKGDNQNY